jgi:hypothetical protein
VVEHLFCKCEALNSNPSPTKKKKKKKKKKERKNKRLANRISSTASSHFINETGLIAIALLLDHNDKTMPWIKS